MEIYGDLQGPEEGRAGAAGRPPEAGMRTAVRIGGGGNHRIGLFDMVILKDNHIDFAGGITPAIRKTQAYLKEKGKNIPIEVEVRSLDDIREVLSVGGVDFISVGALTHQIKSLDLSLKACKAGE